MIKIAVAVIKNEDKILLVRRTPDDKFPDFWELPGGKAASGERASVALKRKLSEKLNLETNVGKLITSATNGNYEVYAYGVTLSSDFANISKNIDTKWVSLDEISKYDLVLPADRKILMNISKTKDPKEQKEPFWTEYLEQRLSKPSFYTEEQCWIVVSNENFAEPETHKFLAQQIAIDFYIKKARQILMPIFKSKPSMVR